ncbi:hypothetical protein SLE2022_154010 [Rubroshorea leprosula]
MEGGPLGQRLDDRLEWVGHCNGQLAEPFGNGGTDGATVEVDQGSWRLGRVQVMGCGWFGVGEVGLVGEGSRSEDANDVVFWNEEEAAGGYGRR